MVENIIRSLIDCFVVERWLLSILKAHDILFNDDNTIDIKLTLTTSDIFVGALAHVKIKLCDFRNSMLQQHRVKTL